jgi:hydrogenase expression/formation protein HypC
MRVLEVSGLEDELPVSPSAQVELDGLRQEVRLDIVDRPPAPGDYVIVHAGFAIHTLSAGEAEINLSLMRQMAEGLDDARD